tara:strand:+ start:293 stop:487 length:195 start_codon:yes stop_codon:yes gene_type:complete
VKSNDDNQALSPYPGRPLKPESRGLGDTLAKALTGLSRGLIMPCGRCKKRQELLNKYVSYRRKK